MTTEQRNKTWACLPKDERYKIISVYACKNGSNSLYNDGYRDALRQLYGHHNLTSDTEPEEMLMVSRSEVQDRFNTFNNPNWASNEEEAYGAQLVIDTLDLLFGDKCLSDKEPSVQGEPKFKVGQQVKIILCTHPEYRNKIGIITSIDSCGNPYVKVDGLGTLFHAPYALEPYTEPETKDIPNCNTCIYESHGRCRITLGADGTDAWCDINNKDCPCEKYKQKQYMEEKELNLAELLKGCEGEEFYTLDNGCVVLDEIRTNNARGDGIIFLIFHAKNFDSGSILINPNGKSRKYGEVILFPSRALYEKYPLDAKAAWMEWKSERTPKLWGAKLGDVYYHLDECLDITKEIESADYKDNIAWNVGNYFRTEEEAQQAAEAVRECLMKFHEKNSEK